MTGWVAVLLASALCFATKLAGHLVPRRVLERPAVARTAALVTVALLTALVTVQTLADGDRVVLDARVPALGVAAVLLWRRAPFVVVVAAAAATAAGVRAVS